MGHPSASPDAEYTPFKVDDEELPPAMQEKKQHFDRDSSSDDVPLRQKRPLRASADSPHENDYDPRDRQEPHDTHTTNPRRVKHQSTPKIPKKPGPRPWASKPIKKNDLAAKLEVIHAIEQHWGKGFIRAYVPKCHRPLVKKGTGNKRAAYREHEADPKKWLPSVLKAILRLAQMTADKKWLKEAMDGVVRYRIKNTGMLAFAPLLLGCLRGCLLMSRRESQAAACYYRLRCPRGYAPAGLGCRV